MAYRQETQSTYQETTNHYQHSVAPISYPQHSYAPDYPPQRQNAIPYSEYEDQSTNYDGKSTRSFQSNFGGSQVHLNPYEMTQINVHSVPPVPAMPYQNYSPPQGRPGGMCRDQSSAGYSLAREKMLRSRSTRQVALQHGNLVLDMQVPSHIIPSGKSDIEEFTKMRYTAATCDPDVFMSSKYTLRPYLYGRETELFIVMTMYNEDEVLFVRTMNSVIKNIYVAGIAQKRGAQKDGRRS